VLRPPDDASTAFLGRVLIIAGSDSGGGAGIQADLKSVTALGGYAMTAVTALTAQNTQGVFGIHDVPPEFIAQQIKVVLDDIGADCIKIGMLHRADVVEAVCESLSDVVGHIPIVVDPVMVAKGGHPLLEDAAIDSLRRRLVPIANLLTPNIPEAEVLTETTGLGSTELAERLLALGPAAVVVKGGHRQGPTVVDVLAERGRPPERFESVRINTRHTHGTGCTLASALATGLAQGLDVGSAFLRAHAYVRDAMRTAPGFGRGHGPLNHGHSIGVFRPKTFVEE
jgi:hydroxymethylpyrimidine/phosphomethylpyrimidine kinase